MEKFDEFVATIAALRSENGCPWDRKQTHESLKECLVEETGEVQSVVMKDDYTKVDISKTDIATGEELPGAHLAVLDKDGKVVAEWDTDGKVHRINGLEPGDSTLREVTAPDGYDVAEF